MSFRIGRENRQFSSVVFATEAEAETFLLSEGFRKKKDGGFVRRLPIVTLPLHYVEQGRTENHAEREQVAVLQKLAYGRYGRDAVKYAEKLGYKTETKNGVVEIFDLQHVDIRRCQPLDSHVPGSGLGGSWRYEFD